MDIEQFKKYINTLPEREQYIVSMRLGINGEEHLTLEEIGTKFGVTRERVRQIEDRIMGDFIKNNNFVTDERLRLMYEDSEENRIKIALIRKMHRKKYSTVELGDSRYFVAPLVEEGIGKVFAFRTSLRKVPSQERQVKLQSYVRKLGLPEPIATKLIDSLNDNKVKVEFIIDVLASRNYPMHYAEIYDELNGLFSKSRNVLACLQRYTEIFARVNNGTYTLVSPKYKRSVPFIKTLIVEYLQSHKRATPQELYKHISGIRDCTRNSILLYLSFNDNFELIAKNTYALRQTTFEMKNVNIVERLLQNEFSGKKVELKDLIVRIKKENSEVSITEILSKLKQSGYQVVNNIIIKE